MSHHPSAIAIYDAVPRSVLAAAREFIESLGPESFDVYSHPFEPKIQVKKQLYNNLALWRVVLAINERFGHLFAQMFGDLPALQPSSNYFRAFYIYRTGDYLQNHIDAAFHDNERKVVTANLYLTDCEGGELFVGDQAIPPAAGCLVVFANRDNAYHRVSPVRSGRRIMLTTGFCMPADMFPRPDFTWNNKKAWFAPAPGEEWTEEQFKMRNERADPNWRPVK
jgi:Rps23 Pro-64 3,4-dihydroxylase Tpa1-like proline 4-hydroxylase